MKPTPHFVRAETALLPAKLAEFGIVPTSRIHVASFIADSPVGEIKFNVFTPVRDSVDVFVRLTFANPILDSYTCRLSLIEHYIERVLEGCRKRIEKVRARNEAVATGVALRAQSMAVACAALADLGVNGRKHVYANDDGTVVVHVGSSTTCTCQPRNAGRVYATLLTLRDL